MPDTVVLPFLGCRDSQVKVMGFRVGLGNVEATLNACPGIEEAVALSKTALRRDR
ncbi:MAG: hypothetical protein AB7G62_08305 [Magnetospirillum sp.]